MALSLGRQDCKIALKSEQNWGMPPLQVGHQALGSKSPDIGPKMERILSEDLFFLPFVLGKKWDEI